MDVPGPYQTEILGSAVVGLIEEYLGGGQHGEDRFGRDIDRQEL